MDDWLLELIQCPLTGERLREAPTELVDRLNQQVDAQTLRFRNGEPVALPLDAGLLNESETLLYPVFEHVPNLIPDEAIELPGLPAKDSSADSSQPETRHGHSP